MMRQLFWALIFLIPMKSVLSDFHLDFSKPFGGIFDPIFPKQRPLTYNQDVSTLHHAITSKEADEDGIINILTTTDANGRGVLSKTYESYYGTDLINDLKNKLTGKFEEAIIALMTPSHYYYVEEIHDSIRGIRSDESALIDTLCLLNNSVVRMISNTYREYYGRPIERDLQQYTVGNFMKLMTKCSRGMRNEHPVVDQIKTYYDSDDGMSNELAIDYLATRSFEEIRRKILDYPKVTGKFVEKQLIVQMASDDYRRVVAGIMQYAKLPEMYFADRFHEVLGGKEVDYRGLIRLVIMSKSVSYPDIKTWYEKHHKNYLDSVIESKTSGSFQKLIGDLLYDRPRMVN